MRVLQAAAARVAAARAPVATAMEELAVKALGWLVMAAAAAMARVMVEAEMVVVEKEEVKAGATVVVQAGAMEAERVLKADGFSLLQATSPQPTRECKDTKYGERHGIPHNKLQRHPQPVVGSE